MSKDSSITYLHMHHPRLADQFEDFTRPHISLSAASNLLSSSNNAPAPTTTTTTTGPNGTTVTVTYGATTTPSSTIPSYLPIEEIYLPPHYQPINPEDEDDVVPDQHAAFGIARAMDAAGRRRVEPVWRDLGMRELVRGETLAAGTAQRIAGRTVGRGGGTSSNSRGGGGGGGMPLGSGATVGLVRQTGSLMGGRRVACLR